MSSLTKIANCFARTDGWADPIIENQFNFSLIKNIFNFKKSISNFTTKTTQKLASHF